MRLHTIPVLLLALMLAACTTRGTVPPSKHISQEGALRVHPGLVGQPVPPELRNNVPAQSAPATGNSAEPRSETPMRLDPVGLRTQRSVYFDLNSADIKPAHEAALKAHGEYLASHSAARVRIEGHADERGSEELNQRLGKKRADKVRAQMVAAGASPRQIGIVSHGKRQPKLKGHDEASWAENRRADVVYEKED